MFRKLFKSKKRRVVVLGIDGVPCGLLEEMVERDVMPNMARLIEMGTLSPMNASIPEVSSTSWSCFMTGVNPAKHSIFGFMELDRKTYSWRFPNFHNLKAKTIWEIASEHGKRNIVINIPSTYPARPLRGMLVAGFVALDLQKACYPEEMYQYLKRINYKLDVDASKAVTEPDEFKNDILQTFQKRKEAILHLFDSEEWDLFIAAITETDRLHHYLWSAYRDPSHREHQFFIDFYKLLDTFIGEFYRRLNGEIPFIIVSDHGFTEIKQEVYLNWYLRELGYLRFTTETPESFRDISPESTAFALDPSRIYVHLKGKFSNGPVSPSSYYEIRDSLKNDLLRLKHDGQQVIKRVYLKEEIYSGEELEDAPDLVAMPEEGFDLKGSIKKNSLFGRSALTGGHTRSNATFYINRKASLPDDIEITDVGATVLSLLGIVGEGLDGRRLL